MCPPQSRSTILLLCPGFPWLDGGMERIIFGVELLCGVSILGKRFIARSTFLSLQAHSSKNLTVTMMMMVVVVVVCGGGK